MNINWQALAEGTTTGISASVVIALYLSLRSRARSLFLRRSIRKSVRQFDFGSGLHGLTLYIQNKTDKQLVVRGISVAGAKARYRLSSTGKVEALQLFPDRKPTKKELADLKAGKIVAMSQELSMSYEWNTQPPSNGFATIQPYTSQEFLLPAQFLVDWDDSIQSIMTSIEYTDWSDSVRLLHVIQSDRIEIMTKTLDHYRTEINSGSLNKARTMFRLPPLKIPAKTAEAKKEPNNKGCCGVGA